MNFRRISGPRRALLLALIAVGYLVAPWIREGRIRIGDAVLWPPDRGAAEVTQPGIGEAGAREIERMFAERRSDVVVRVRGRVDRVLADDNEGSRHQRFILALPSGHTVLVAHNIDLARRVPLGRGDQLEVKGEYEWNDRGGVLHWTHHDPQRRHEGGWIKHEGETYE